VIAARSARDGGALRGPAFSLRAAIFATYIVRSARGIGLSKRRHAKERDCTMLRKFILTTAAAALVAAPVAAQAQAAPARAASPVAETEQLSQELLLILGAVSLALLVLIFSDSGDHPTSP
jgi:hypothetical protein